MIMQRFFFEDEQISDGRFSVAGEKFNHIVRSLRMTPGERAVFCDGEHWDYECELLSADAGKACFKVINKYENKTEPGLRITVFQCLPKGEKMEEMVKRCVQFGVYRIIPVLSRRCVSRPDGKSAAKRIDRLNKVSRSSAMQSMRGIVPKVESIIDFKDAIEQMKGFSNSFICYENEEQRVFDIPPNESCEAAFMVGPEGGFDEAEIEYANANKIPCVTLGRRILRTEDAAAFLIPILLYNTGNI